EPPGLVERDDRRLAVERDRVAALPRAAAVQRQPLAPLLSELERAIDPHGVVTGDRGGLVALDGEHVVLANHGGAHALDGRAGGALDDRGLVSVDLAALVA